MFKLFVFEVVVENVFFSIFLCILVSVFFFFVVLSSFWDDVDLVLIFVGCVLFFFVLLFKLDGFVLLKFCFFGVLFVYFFGLIF